VWASVLIGCTVLLVCLGGQRSFWALVLLLIAFASMRRLCLGQIGGQTGDNAGALEQLAEIAILCLAAAHT
jgi:adenosylcobinamide-GDP ribazoletransferase